MMIKVIPHPKLKRDYKGKRVRLIKAISNAFVCVPSGKVATIIEQSPKGSYLKFDACECCSINAQISSVPSTAFEFIEEEND